MHLDEEFKNEKLDFFVLFSSIAGIFGNSGQCDYAYANRFMDAFAYYRTKEMKKGNRYGKSLSIDWPLWQGGGMNMTEESQHALFEQTGMVALPVEAGIHSLQRTLALSTPQVSVLYGLKHEIQAFVNKEREVVPALPEENMKIDPALLFDKTLAYLKERLGSELKVPAADIDCKAHFEQFGVDSIITTRFNGKVEKDIGNISKTLLFEYHNLNDLAGYFAKNHKKELVEFFGFEQETERAVVTEKTQNPQETWINLSPLKFKQKATPKKKKTQTILPLSGLAGVIPERRI